MPGVRGLGADLQCLLAGVILSAATLIAAIVLDALASLFPAPRFAGYPLADLIGFASIPAALGVLAIRSMRCVLLAMKP